MMYALREDRKALCDSAVLMEANALELRVLLCLTELSAATPADLAAAARCTEADATAALQFWRGAGIVGTCHTAAVKTDNPPSTADTAVKEKPLRHESKLSLPGCAQTARLIDDRKLGDFLNACQQTAGQIFNPNDTEIAVALCEQLGLAPEYVLTLIAYCFGMGKRSMAYVEKVAFSFVQDLGIDTPEMLDSHLRTQELLHSAEGQLRRLFGIGDRSLSKRESAAFCRWLADFGYQMPMIEAAYDKTVNATGKASVTYTDKILCRWHENGCKSVADAEALDMREAQENRVKSKPASPAKEPPKPTATSFDVDEFFARALERSYGPGAGDAVRAHTDADVKNK